MGVLVKVASKKKQSVNGRHYGWWIEFDDGQQMYVAFRAGTRDQRGYNRKQDAWLIDTRVLHEARARGITHIGLVAGKTKRTYYATWLEDFFGPKSQAFAGKDSPQRMLMRNAWRINPMIDEGNIARAMRLR